MGRLEERSAELRADRVNALLSTRGLRLAARSRPWEITDEARWGPSVIAFLFALPGSAAVRAIDAAGEYFAVRTGDAWDLFLPGYVRDEKKVPRERRLGGSYARGMSFAPEAFDSLRAHVEAESGGRWQYSGGTDLVLVNTWLSPDADPVIDWASTASGSLTEASAGLVTLGIAEVVERISRDLEQNLEDPMYGVGDIDPTSPASPAASSIMRDLFVTVTGEIVAALAVKSAGL